MSNSQIILRTRPSLFLPGQLPMLQQHQQHQQRQPLHDGTAPAAPPQGAGPAERGGGGAAAAQTTTPKGRQSAEEAATAAVAAAQMTTPPPQLHANWVVRLNIGLCAPHSSNAVPAGGTPAVPSAWRRACVARPCDFWPLLCMASASQMHSFLKVENTLYVENFSVTMLNTIIYNHCIYNICLVIYLFILHVKYLFFGVIQHKKCYIIWYITFS